jgi:hypothetical protein
MQSSYEQTSPRGHWLRWAETLRRYHLDGFAAWMLDGGQPLAILSAQALYFVRPFLDESADALARTLESDEELREFVSFLNRGADSWT